MAALQTANSHSRPVPLRSVRLTASNLTPVLVFPVSRQPVGQLATCKQQRSPDRRLEVGFDVLDGDGTAEEIRTHEFGEGGGRLVKATGVSDTPCQGTVGVVDQFLQVLWNGGVIVPHSVLIQGVDPVVIRQLV